MNPDENKNNLFTGTSPSNPFATLGFHGVPSTGGLTTGAGDSTQNQPPTGQNQPSTSQTQSSTFDRLQQQVNLAQQVNAAANQGQAQGQPEFFTSDAPEEVNAEDLGSNDSIDDLQAELDATTQRVQDLSSPTQEEIELSSEIQQEDLQAQQAQRQLFGQGMGTPLSLLQGEERKMQEQRAFERGFDQLELDLLERSRQRERQVAEGQLSRAQAEAEQIQDARDANDKMIERLATTFQGTDLNELSTANPEVYSRLVNSVANSSYSLGEVEQALKPEDQNLTIRNVGGRVVGINPQTGEVEQDFGASSNASRGSDDGVDELEQVQEKVLANKPFMGISTAKRLTQNLYNRGVSADVIDTITRNEKTGAVFESGEVTVLDPSQVAQLTPGQKQVFSENGFVFSEGSDGGSNKVWVIPESERMKLQDNQGQEASGGQLFTGQEQTNPFAKLGFSGVPSE